MNCLSKKTARVARIIFLLAGIFLTFSSRAQAGEAPVDNRLLLVFDTASDMKRREPAEQKALDTVLANSLNGQLHSGDSIGVWTFDRELRAGEFPLQSWNSEKAAAIASKITVFIGKHRYEKKTNFKSLQPLLNQVVENSERLTVLIFCDGEDVFSGTPFDAGINRVFRQKGAAQKNARQPFVIALRAQLGQYIGCTVSCPPPMQLKLPAFSPLPLPPAPKPKPVGVPPPSAPVVFAPPLIIIGTNVTNHIPPPAPPEILSKKSPPIIVATPVIEVITNTSAPSPKISPPKKNGLPVVISPARANPTLNISKRRLNENEKTNEVAAGKNSNSGGNRSWIGDAIVLIAVFALGIFVPRRARKTDSGLVTRSVDKK